MCKNNINLLEIDKLVKYFPVRGGILQRPLYYIRAVDEVSFNIRNGETFGLVGESGCGKTTVARCITYLEAPSSGEILFQGNKLSANTLKKARKNIQMVFQDPYSSLNPRMNIESIIGEPLYLQGIKAKEREKRVKETLEMVGLHRKDSVRYPHEFSGGQRQRISIARAISIKPKFVICDEPTSALDVSIQAQILNLLMDLQSELNLTYLFVSHDLSVVRHISDRVAVMYLGKIVEMASSEVVFDNPIHPYTKLLLSAIPKPQFDTTVKRSDIKIMGGVPSAINPPSGCHYHPRCLISQDVCKQQRPTLKEIYPGHVVSCHLINTP